MKPEFVCGNTSWNTYINISFICFLTEKFYSYAYDLWVGIFSWKHGDELMTTLPKRDTGI